MSRHPMRNSEIATVALLIVVAGVVLASLLSGCGAGWKVRDDGFTLATAEWGAAVYTDDAGTINSVYIEGHDLPRDWSITTGDTATGGMRFVLIQRDESEGHD